MTTKYGRNGGGTRAGEKRLAVGPEMIGPGDNNNTTTTTPTKVIIPPPPPPPLSLPVWSLACPSLPGSTFFSRAAAATRPANRPDDDSERDDDDNGDPFSLPPRRCRPPSPPPPPLHSMNIVTFCTCLSVAESNKLYAVSLYHDTLTKDSFIYHGIGILQLLRPHHKALVPILGRQSGYDDNNRNKQEQCQQLGHVWHEYQHHHHHHHDDIDDHHDDNDEEDHGTTTFRLLSDCATYLVLQVVETVEAGDHLLTICRVMDTLAWQEQVGAADNNNKGPSTTGRIVSLSLSQQQHPPQQQQQRPGNDSVVARIAAAAASGTALQVRLDPSNTLYTGQLREEGIL